MTENSNQKQNELTSTDLGRSMEQISHNTGKKLGALATELIKVSTETVDDGKKYLEKNPVKSLAIATAAGWPALHVGARGH